MDLTTSGTLLLALLIIFMLIFTTRNRKNRSYNLPPGPTPLPLIGNLLHIKKGETVKSFMQLAQKYGSVYTIYFGSRPVVILSGYQTVKEALIDQGEEFSGRGKVFAWDKVTKGYGLLFSNGERWKQLRRFTLMTLKNFGMGKRSIEERVQEEARFMLAELKKSKKSLIDPTNILLQTVANVICSVVFGNRFEYTDLQFLKLLNMFNEDLQILSSAWGQLNELFPEIMEYIPGPHHKLDKILNDLLQFVSEKVQENKETLDPTSPRDFIDCFLIKMEQDRQNPTSEFEMRNFLFTVLNLFFAGTETMSTTLRHGLLILVTYPEIQAKVHEEIDRVIGQNRCPVIEDRIKMPYTDAVLHEIQRFSDIVPMNIPHSVTKDTQFHGYTIPKGTKVYPLLTTVLHDPTQFATPDRFNPGHFLDDKGCFKKNEAFLPFSTGKRICPAEGLARMEIFLFLTNILQKFTVTSPTHFTDADIVPKMTGMFNLPIPYQISFEPR
ncbi:cytochrome P450 2A4-like [Rhinophrynus dorsalis]